MCAVCTSVAGLAVLEVLDERVRAREHQTLLTGVRPADEVRRAPVLVTYLENLGVAIMVSNTVAVDDQAISNRCEHGSNPPVSRRTLYAALLPLFAPAARIPRAVRHLVHDGRTRDQPMRGTVATFAPPPVRGRPRVALGTRLRRAVEIVRPGDTRTHGDALDGLR
jgi:hypothetical protein